MYMSVYLRLVKPFLFRSFSQQIKHTPRKPAQNNIEFRNLQICSSRCQNFSTSGLKMQISLPNNMPTSNLAEKPKHRERNPYCLKGLLWIQPIQIKLYDERDHF